MFAHRSIRGARGMHAFDDQDMEPRRIDTAGQQLEQTEWRHAARGRHDGNAGVSFEDCRRSLIERGKAAVARFWLRKLALKQTAYCTRRLERLPVGTVRLGAEGE